MIRLAIFDCDGTLVDSGASIHRAVERTFAFHGLVAPPRSQAQKVIGLSLPEAMQRLSPDGDALALTATYKDIFFGMRSEGELEEPLFEGIVGLLDAMEKDGWLLGVATGKSDRGLHHALELHGLRQRFVTLQTSDRNPSKPHPAMALAAMADVGAEPGHTVFIGDTAWDMGCAVNSGVGAIGVGWGYHDADTLIDGGAHAIAMRPADVLCHAQDWLGRGE